MNNPTCPECGGRMTDRGRWGWQCFGKCRQAQKLNPYAYTIPVEDKITLWIAEAFMRVNEKDTDS